MVPDIVVVILRYSLLVLLYLFIWRLFAHMLKELRKVGREQVSEGYQGLSRPVTQVALWAAGSGMLKVLEGPEGFSPPGYGFAIDKQLKIGRSSENAVVINSPFVSGQHARIIFQEDKYFLEDLGSRNGTLVNGVKVKKPVSLAEGDRIQVGEVLFDFVRWANEVESTD